MVTHYIRHFPLNFPSCASHCAITFQLDSTDEDEKAGKAGILHYSIVRRGIEASNVMSFLKSQEAYKVF